MQSVTFEGDKVTVTKTSLPLSFKPSALCDSAIIIIITELK